MRSGARRRKGARRCEAERGTAEAVRSGGGAVLVLGVLPSKSRNNPSEFFRNSNNFFKTIDFFFSNSKRICMYYPPVPCV